MVYNESFDKISTDFYTIVFLFDETQIVIINNLLGTICMYVKTKHLVQLD